MKKIIPTTLLIGLLLTGCSENRVNTEENKVKKYVPIESHVKLGKEFEVTVNDIRTSEVEEKFKLKVDNFKIQSNMSSNENTNKEKDFIELDISVENIGDTDLTSFNVSPSSFSFFNENGVEIDSFPLIGDDNEKDTFKPSTIRPNGKNKGKIYITIPKGERVSEMIFYDNIASKDRADTFIFKINN
ncbi:DUF4352 domain-containing protein [Cytobacillus firmus]|uniref:DUF4352 domain-containing protein n=1 Tax=Cytobacillus firmus TaxID=1399 RepID=UPI0036C75C91